MVWRVAWATRRVAAAVVLLLLVTSTSGPAVSWGQTDDPAPDDAPLEFTQEGDVVEVLGAGGEAFDLTTCVRHALDANAVLLEEREGLRELQAKTVQARSEGLPRIDLVANWNRGRDPSFALDATFTGGEADTSLPDLSGFLPSPEDIPAQSFWRGYLDVYWELRLTRVIRALRAAQSAIRRQESIVVDTENRTIEDVLNAYYSVILAHERLKAAEAEIDARYEFLETTRHRLQLDLATPLDTLRAAVSWANLEPQRRRSRQEVRQAGQDLNVLMGRDPLDPIRIVASFPIETDEIPPNVALHLASRRPDVEQQQLQSDLLRIQRGVQKAQNHPYVTTEGSWGVLGHRVGDVTNRGHDFWRISVSLRMPLWDGQLVRGQVQETNASIRRNEHAVDEQIRRARSEVLTALEELAVARTDLAAADLNMSMAQEAFELISLRYELGRADYLEVLDAQAERFVARSTLLSARYQVLSGTATLKRTMGMSPMQPLSAALELARNLETSP